MIIFRIVLKKYSNELFAPGIPGRWNSDGNKVIYTAGSIALAVMENLIYRKGQGFSNHYATMLIDLPDHLAKTAYTSDTLPTGWNSPDKYSVSQPIGDNWYKEGLTPVLKIPSAVVPQEYNYVINSTHADFAQIKLIKVAEYVPDERIDDILKKYPKT